VSIGPGVQLVATEDHRAADLPPWDIREVLERGRRHPKVSGGRRPSHDVGRGVAIKTVGEKVGCSGSRSRDEVFEQLGRDSELEPAPGGAPPNRLSVRIRKRA